MTRKQKTAFSVKIGKEDFELRAMIKRIEQQKLSISDVAKKAIKFYYKHALSTNPDPKYEKIFLEYQRKAEMEKFNESREKVSKINKRLRELE